MGLIKNGESFSVTVKDNEIYKVSDLGWQNITVSKTILHKESETRGHTHPDKWEVYVFTQGNGIIVLGKDIIDVNVGDTILVEPNTFHKVINTTETDLVFVSVFNDDRNH